MDPQVQEFLQQLQRVPRPGWETMRPATARRVYRNFRVWSASCDALRGVTNRQITTTTGVQNIRVYQPERVVPKSPVVVYFHGGGWVIGDLDTHDGLCRQLCHAAQAVVVSVAYRLAPEHSYPAPVDDCAAAVAYVAAHADELGIDVAKICVAGDSAGGNLAAVVALRFRNQDALAMIHKQVLIYPITDCDLATDSYRERAEGFGLTAASMRWFWDCYVPDPANRSRPDISPLRHTTLTDLPQTLLITAEYDVLRDEGMAFGEKLRDARNDVRHEHFPGMIHGFTHFSAVFDEGRRSLALIGEFIRS